MRIGGCTAKHGSSGGCSSCSAMAARRGRLCLPRQQPCNSSDMPARRISSSRLLPCAKLPTSLWPNAHTRMGQTVSCVIERCAAAPAAEMYVDQAVQNALPIVATGRAAERGWERWEAAKTSCGWPHASSWTSSHACRARICEQTALPFIGFGGSVGIHDCSLTDTASLCSLEICALFQLESEGIY